MEQTALAERRNGDLVNAATGEVATMRVFENEFDVSTMLGTAGTVELTKQQREILFAPVNQEDVEIRADGIVYLPWMEYASRLSEAFGLQWALIPQGMPKFKNNAIYWGFWLVIKGSLCGYAIGEQKYFPQSQGGRDFMSYTDATEGAKSNALMRLCKGIGISLELWRPSFVREWKSKYATVYADSKGKKVWKKKTAKDEPVNEVAQEIPQDDIPDFKPHDAPEKPEAMMTDPQKRKIWHMMQEAGLNTAEGAKFWEFMTPDGPMTKKDASLFIERFDAKLEEFQKTGR